MSWEENAFEVLRSKLESRKVFTSSEANSLLSSERGFRRGTTRRMTHALAKKGRLIRLGRGIYKIEERDASGSLNLPRRGIEGSGTLPAPDVDNIAMRALEGRGIGFRVTGPSLLTAFVHHLPRKMMHLIYVIRGAGENAKEALKEVGLRTLLEPSRNETRLALREFPERDIFIVRELSEVREGSGLADLETAIVDTYFESTRNRIPFPPEEVGRMIAKLVLSNRLSLSHLLMHAGRRGIRPEFRTIIENLVPDLVLTGPHLRNEKVTTVLSGISAEAR